MKCQSCKRDFEEKDIHESHDVPTYLWEGNRQGRKNQADKWGRHYLCKECHDKYEQILREHLRSIAKDYCEWYFLIKKEKDGDSVPTV